MNLIERGGSRKSVSIMYCLFPMKGSEASGLIQEQTSQREREEKQVSWMGGDRFYRFKPLFAWSLEVLVMKGNEMKERRKTEGFLVSHDKKTIIRLTSRHGTQVTDTHRLFFYPGCLLSFVSIQMNDQIALWVEIQGREREREISMREERKRNE